MILIILLFFSTNSHAITLEGALKSTLQKNETVSQAHERVVQAKERLDQAKSGPQPTLSFEGTHMIQPEIKNPLYRQFSPEEQTTTGLRIAQPLFRGFREFAVLRQRKDLVAAEKANEDRSLARLYEEVATSYFQILAFEQDLRNLEDQRRLYGERVKNLQARARRGESARNEPLSAQSAEAVVEAELEVVRSRLKRARENFSYLTGLSADVELSDDKLEAELLNQVKGLKHYLDRISTRPDIQAIQKNTEAASEGIAIARGAHWPTLDLVGNYYFQRPSGFLSEIDWDLQFQLTFPIYEGGLRVSQVQEAASIKLEAELELSRAKRAAESEIRALHESLIIQVKHLKALQKATELSRRNSQVLERDYRRGLSRNIDVQAALTEYGVARRNYDQARYAARLDLISLERAANILPSVIEEYAKKESL